MKSGRAGGGTPVLGMRRPSALGAVRVSDNARQPARWRNRLALMTVLLTAGGWIFAGKFEQNPAPASKFKTALLSSAHLKPTLPTFRFDDADSVVSEAMQTAFAAAEAARPSEQTFQPMTFVSHYEENEEIVPDFSLPMASPIAAESTLPPIAGSLPTQALAPVESLNENSNQKKTVEIKPGDNLYTILKNNGVDASDIHAIMLDDMVKEHLTNLRIGNKIDFDYRWTGELNKVSIKVNRDTRLHIHRSAPGSIQVAKTHLPLEYERVVTSGTINESLYAAAEQADLKQSTIMSLADIFEWELDFARDIRKGDSFSIVYDRLYRDGKYIGDGEILAAEFVRGDRHHRAIRFTDDDGRIDYYSPDGQSKRRSFMRHPVDVVRITSRFDPNRMHPVLHKIRAHKGVDYGAPHGSPIKATADGVVEFAGNKGAYGNTVILQHGEQRSTLYAHMSRIAGKSIRGKRVRRGDVIGYVGRTGRVTGTHLHYEFRIRGMHVDPLKVELPVAAALDKKYLPKLKAMSQELIAQMRSVVPADAQRVADAR